MSYCRFGEGDVYMYPNVKGIVCCSCRLNPAKQKILGKIVDWYKDVIFKTSKEALKHLEAHKKAGHRIPKHAFDRLKKESK